MVEEKERVLLNIEDYHQRAKEKLPRMFYDYYNTGSDDQLTLLDNIESFRRIKIRPKILVDVSSDFTSRCSTKIPFPILIAPTAFHRLADNEYGELSTVRAAVACSTIMCVSTAASTRMEIIADEYHKQIKENYPQSLSQLWYQLYVFKNRIYSQKLIERAQSSGYKALVITVDTPQVGNRELDFRNQFSLPDGIQPENLIDENNHFIQNHHQFLMDSSLSWNDIHWIQSITSLPIILKGILHPDDALLAIKYNIQGIIVSNHGGRQLDTTISSIDALQDIVNVVRKQNSQIDIYLDGGIRRGTDIFKAIALGAKAVLIGRPILWGLAVQGEQGVKNILNILKKEFQLAMNLSGCVNIEDITKNNLLVIRSKL
jgi:isopentenyl diphosphate isomerase/L-lactate dehydrogenase-like FMN-dependent dehydrogenase